MATPYIDFPIVTDWFYGKCKVMNQGKCNFICLGKETENETFFYDNTESKNSKEEKILGIIIDNKLKLRSQMKKLSQKAFQKMWALSRSTDYLKLILDAIIKTWFSYSLLVWIFCSRQTINMINKLYKRVLRFSTITSTVLINYIRDFETLLQKIFNYL